MTKKTKKPKPVRRIMNENQKAVQFKPGQSGNPNGRPPGTPNFKTVVRALLEQEVQNAAKNTFWTGRKKIMAIEMMAVVLYRKALAGDIAAIRELIDRSGETITQNVSYNLKKEDDEILERVLSRGETYAKYAEDSGDIGNSE